MADTDWVTPRFLGWLNVDYEGGPTEWEWFVHGNTFEECLRFVHEVGSADEWRIVDLKTGEQKSGRYPR